MRFGNVYYTYNTDSIFFDAINGNNVLYSAWDLHSQNFVVVTTTESN